MTLPADVRDWPPDALEAYRERLAIIEVHGEVAHRFAVTLAEARVRMEWERCHHLTPETSSVPRV